MMTRRGSKNEFVVRSRVALADGRTVKCDRSPKDLLGALTAAQNPGWFRNPTFVKLVDKEGRVALINPTKVVAVYPAKTSVPVTPSAVGDGSPPHSAGGLDTEGRAGSVGRGIAAQLQELREAVWPILISFHAGQGHVTDEQIERACRAISAVPKGPA